MDKYSMKNQLTNAMANCRKCKMKRDRVSNNIELPDCIVKLICSFLRCKRCAKTNRPTRISGEPILFCKYQSLSFEETNR